MAHAFDNRNCIPGKQQKFHSVVSPPPSRPDTKISSSPPSSPRPNHPPPSYEESVYNKALVNRQNSKSSYRDHCNPISSSESYSSSTHNDSTHRQRPTDEYCASISDNCSSDTKPPPPARMPRITSTTNNNYIRRTNALSQYSPNGMKTSTTYLNTTQLYITQPSSSRDHQTPPPPPPRYPLHPPAIPPRGSLACNQKNSVTIPDFNSFISPKAIYRSPVVSSTINNHHLLEHRFDSLSIDSNNHIRDTTNGSTIGEYFGECRKCGETITSLDDPCDILGQLYHSSCAICVLCGRSVKNKHFFVKDDLYCEEDFLYTGFHQTLENCVACGHLITDTILQALGQSYHLTCFKCSKCSMSLDGVPFITDKNRNLFCLHDYHMTYGPQCDKCFNPICPEDDSNETVRIISMGKTFHVHCYQCEDCSMQLSDEQDRRCYPLDGALLCQECCYRRLVSVNKF